MQSRLFSRLPVGGVTSSFLLRNVAMYSLAYSRARSLASSSILLRNVAMSRSGSQAVRRVSRRVSRTVSRSL